MQRRPPFPSSRAFSRQSVQLHTRTRQGETMMARKSFATAILAATAAFAITVSVRAGGDKVAFPPDFDKALMYTMVDRADLKEYRELFVMPASALDAAKKGEPLPSGTVLAMAHY